MKMNELIPQATKNITMFQSVQKKSTIQTQTTAFHSGLVVQTKPCDKGKEILGMNITINAIVMHRHTRLHDCRRNWVRNYS